MKEIWKNIDPDGIYKVSNLGRVKTTIRQGCSVEFLKPCVNKKGYLQVDMRYGGKRHIARVHRLVALAFIPNPDNLPEINHKDENKKNNRIDNLEWCTHLYNIRYGTGSARGKESLKYDINQYDFSGKLIRQWRGMNVLARTLGIESTCVLRSCKGETRTYNGYIWCYADDPWLDEKVQETVEWLKRGNHARYGKGTTVRQYDPHGKLVATFHSLREAERATGVSSCTLSWHFKRRKECTLNGYKWSKV